MILLWKCSQRESEGRKSRLHKSITNRIGILYIIVCMYISLCVGVFVWSRRNWFEPNLNKSKIFEKFIVILESGTISLDCLYCPGAPQSR